MAYFVDSKYRLLSELAKLMALKRWPVNVTCSRTKLTLTFPANDKFDKIVEGCIADEIGGGYQEALNGKRFEITVKQV